MMLKFENANARLRKVHVEGADDHSDDDDDTADGGPSLLSPITSPLGTSKKARKRQAAAAKKRQAKDANSAAVGEPVTTRIGSDLSLHEKQRAGNTSTSNGVADKETMSNNASISKGDLSQVAAQLTNGLQRAADLGTAARDSMHRVNAALTDATAKAMNRPPAAPSQQHDDAASIASTEEEDMSLLIEDDSSTASEMGGDAHDERDESYIVEASPSTPDGRISANDYEAKTPRAFQANSFVEAQAGARGAVQQGIDVASSGTALKQSSQIQAKSTIGQLDQAVAAYGQDHDPTKKWKSIATRTIWTLVMIGGFCGLLAMGHVYLIILVIVCQALVFKEISALFDVAAKPLNSHRHDGLNGRHSLTAVSSSKAARDAKAKAERERWSKVTSWYFFAATNYFLHGETMIYYFKHIVFVDAYFVPFARHHRFISFMLYTLGFVGFVTNLKRNQLRRQFGLFCWIHMSLLLIVVSSHFIVNNILEGIIWFWLPASLVIMNDIAAYVWGMLFGRTQLIKLSPKKTVEGFVGAFFTTVVFGYLWATAFMRFPYMICPATDLGTTAFSAVACTPNDVFQWTALNVPQEATAVIQVVTGFSITHLPYAPFQLHAIVMAVFASLVAPFGGFFASGFKRAFNVKDFGDSIPGHGGMTDRMDCQFLMGLFAYVYYSSIIRDNHVTVGSVMQIIVSSLSSQEQVELAKALTGYLAQQGYSYR